MHQIDLMPQKCREVLGRRVWIRRWALGYAVTAGMLAMLVWHAGATKQESVITRDRVDAVRTIRWEQNVEAQALQAEISVLEHRIERHNKLAWPVRVSEVIDTIGSVLPEEVSLLTMTFTQREERVGTRGKKRSKGEETQRSILVLVLEGVCENDTPVASLVSGLQSVALFRSVVLDYARNIEIQTLTARSFSVTCEIDLSARYQFVASVEESEDEF